MGAEEIAGIPPLMTPDRSVADRLGASIKRAQGSKTQDLIFPDSDELHLTFRGMTDLSELKQAFDLNPSLSESEAEVQAAINTLVQTSTGSYAVVDGKRVDIGLKLGVSLYAYLFPAEAGEPQPMTDGEAVVLMFGGDTVGLTMFARKLTVWRRIQANVLEVTAGN